MSLLKKKQIIFNYIVNSFVNNEVTDIEFIITKTVINLEW